jgi:hypothetical protein
MECNSLRFRSNNSRWSADVMSSKERVDTNAISSMVGDILANSVASISISSIIDITIMYQSELPYDVDVDYGTNGYAGYRVG